jgi:hypothetical protein
MAELSNQLMAVTVLAYLAAMVMYAAEYAFGNKSHIGRAAHRPARQLVGAGAPVPSTDEEAANEGAADQEAADREAVEAAAVEGNVVAQAPPRDRGATLGKIGVGLNWLAFALHLGTVVTRGIAADRMPWGNMYEFTLTVTLVGSAVWLGVLTRRPALRHLGLFASLALVVLMGGVGLIAYAPVGPLVPALNSYWFMIHVTAIIIASGILLIGVVPATMFLIRSGYDQGKRRFPYPLGAKVPEAALLPVRCGRRRPGAVTGTGTPRKSGRSSRSSCTRATCTPVPPRASSARRPRGSRSWASQRC